MSREEYAKSKQIQLYWTFQFKSIEKLRLIVQSNSSRLGIPEFSLILFEFLDARSKWFR